MYREVCSYVVRIYTSLSVIYLRKAFLRQHRYHVPENMITILSFQQQHKLAVLELLYESYLPEDPAAVAIGIKREDAKLRYERIIEKSLVDGFSFVAVDENGTVIGCRISHLWKRGVIIRL